MKALLFDVALATLATCGMAETSQTTTAIPPGIAAPDTVAGLRYA